MKKIKNPRGKKEGVFPRIVRAVFIEHWDIKAIALATGLVLWLLINAL